ncbi:MAG: NAD-dependent epimerase/dehydratase family protein [Betaproteobacteria bacterium]|nr:NAD-dependent epimerase/dehydratase family protein [Betaproteobacteria bacterium]
MRVLVTGGAGFLGGAAVRALLARGHRVIAFDSQPEALSRLGPSPHLVAFPGDITDMANIAHAVLLHKPDVVIHCAAIVGVVSSVGSPVNVLRVNVEGSLNVFESMRLAGVRRCLHVSSEETYGPFLADRIDEEHPQRPVMPYGICKLAVENLGRTYRELHGLEIVNLRTSWVYGPGLPRHRIPKNLVDAALAGQPLHLPNGADFAIDHTYVDDAVAALLAALDRDKLPHDAYNVASGTATTVGEIAALIRELVPGADVSAGPGALRFNEQLPVVRKGALDVSRAAADLGWRPRFDMRAGLAAYIEACRAGR